MVVNDCIVMINIYIYIYIFVFKLMCPYIVGVLCMYNRKHDIRMYVIYTTYIRMWYIYIYSQSSMSTMHVHN